MENERTPAPAWGWRDFIAAVALTILGTIGLLLIGRNLADALELDTTAGFASPVVYSIGVASMLLMILSVYLFAARRAGWAALGVVPASTRTLVVTPALVLIGFFLLGIVNSVVALIQGAPIENPQVEAISGGQAFSSATLFWMLLLIAGLVPIAEELLFRGMLYPLLRARMGPAAAIVLNAAIFALAHVLPILIPALFVVGLLLAFLREWSGSVVPCILYHMLQNAISTLAITAMLSAA
jgi:hypothetical protein